GTVGAALAPRPDAAWSRRERRSYRVNCYPVRMEFDLHAIASHPLFAATGLLIAAWLAWFVFGRIVLRVLERIAEASPVHWDDALVERRVPQRAAWIVPAVVVLVGLAYVQGLPEFLVLVVRNVAFGWIAIAAALVLGAFLDAINDVYVRQSPSAADRPIKGYLQLLQIVIWVLALILVVAALINKSPLVLLTGLG